MKHIEAMEARRRLAIYDDFQATAEEIQGIIDAIGDAIKKRQKGLPVGLVTIHSTRADVADVEINLKGRAVFEQVLAPLVSPLKELLKDIRLRQEKI